MNENNHCRVMNDNVVHDTDRPQLFHCGTSNVELPVPNKSHFPPEYRDKSRLHYYSSIFNTVEINSTFYRVPLRQTVERWSNDVPENFVFTFKLWRGISHARELMFAPADIHAFMNAVNGIGKKKGCILVQFPASIRFPAWRKVRHLFDELLHAQDAAQWKIAAEFRHPSWYNDVVYEAFEGNGISIVLHDMPSSRTPETGMHTAFAYYRFHGPHGDYKGSYPAGFLSDHAMAITGLVKEGKQVYAYFNNTIGAAVENAMCLARLSRI